MQNNSSIDPIFITGASGFIGQAVIKFLTKQNFSLLALSRHNKSNHENISWIQGNSTTQGEWQTKIDGCKAVINLAGEPIIGKRWNESQKKLIIQSRIETTNRIVEAIEKASIRPQTLVSASAIGFYPKNFEKSFEESDIADHDFLGEVCQAWEDAAHKVEKLGVRLVLLRIGIVIGNGGALAKMLPVFKLGLGGTIGSGTQYMSWIHINDLVHIINFSLKSSELSGPVNCTAPNPVTMKEFCQELGRALHRPTIFSVPEFIIKLMLGESAEVILDSQRVIPKAITKAGYNFQFQNIREALQDIISN